MQLFGQLRTLTNGADSNWVLFPDIRTGILRFQEHLNLHWWTESVKYLVGQLDCLNLQLFTLLRSYENPRFQNVLTLYCTNHTCIWNYYGKLGLWS